MDEEDKGIIKFMHRKGKSVRSIEAYMGYKVKDIQRVCREADEEDRRRDKRESRIMAEEPIGTEEYDRRIRAAGVDNRCMLAALARIAPPQ